MFATHSGFSSYRYLQTTDGTNDYYVGINGTNGFVITPFQGHTSFTFSILINFGSVIDSATTVKRILEIANSARTAIYGNDLGAFTSTLTSEYIGLFTLISGVTRARGVTSATSIAAGWHHIVLAVSGVAPKIIIDGVEITSTNGTGGAPVNATAGFTANQVSLMGTTAGGAPFGCTWREAALLNTAFVQANALDLYQYYTRNGNVSLANSRRSIWRYLGTTTGRSQIIELYKGNESGTDLLASKAAASDLTKTGF